jgi:predicted lipoprotein
VGAVAAAVRRDPEAARKQHAHAAGLGTAYYFVRGTGQVVSQDRNYLRLSLEGPSPTVVALRIGPVFGNAVRDGCGLLDVNQVPGLQEFNALAAELNALVEKTVQPALRQAVVGATITFAGCAEAPESAPAPSAPILNIVPVWAEIR